MCWEDMLCTSKVLQEGMGEMDQLALKDLKVAVGYVDTRALPDPEVLRGSLARKEITEIEDIVDHLTPGGGSPLVPVALHS